MHSALAAVCRCAICLAPDAAPSTTVREGDPTIGSSGTFDPGVHHLTVESSGRAPRALDVTLVEGKQTEVIVDGAPALAAQLVGEGTARSAPAELPNGRGFLRNGQLTESGLEPAMTWTYVHKSDALARLESTASRD